MNSDKLPVELQDVLLYTEKKGKCHTFGRQFSALSFRVNSQSTFLLREKELKASTNSIAHVPANSEYDRVSNGEEVIVFHYHEFNMPMRDIEVFWPQNPQKYHFLFSKALKIWTEHKDGYYYRTAAIFYKILANMTEDGLIGNEESNDIASCTADIMKRQFQDSDITVKDLAKAAFVSETYLRRCFKNRFGISPKQYLDDLRIRYSASLLHTGYYSQTEIAKKCGFTDVKYFRTAYKKKTGMTPKDYQNQSIIQTIPPQNS